jgi:hypothetical protein
MNKKKVGKLKIADIDKLVVIIQNEVSWFNGWACSLEDETKSCRLAVRKILKQYRLTPLK